MFFGFLFLLLLKYSCHLHIFSHKTAFILILQLTVEFLLFLLNLLMKILDVILRIAQHPLRLADHLVASIKL